jgi:phosphoribosylglycinamide formyltransferase 1
VIDARGGGVYLPAALPAASSRAPCIALRAAVAEPIRIAVLASGGGSNLQALLDHFRHGAGAPARVELVVASRPGIGALERAERAGVASAVLDARALPPAEHAAQMLRLLEAQEIELVVLAGYLQLVPLAVVRRFEGRILNIHPALLPAFGGRGMYGMRVHHAVLASGARVSGATVHLVDEEYDRGRIVAQWPVPVLIDDTPDRLAARVLAVEHRLLPAVVEVFARGQTAAPAGTAFRLGDVGPPSPAQLRQLVTAPGGAGPDHHH